MNRRSVPLGTGTGAATVLAGCTRRIDGWSSLRVGLRNALDRAVEVRVRIVGDDNQVFDRRFDLAASARRTVEASVDAPWDARLVFHASRLDSDTTTTERWNASVPLWGGNKCTIEPMVLVDDTGVEITPACVG